MSGVNPVVLIQLMTQYHQQPGSSEKNPRIFSFNKNNLKRVHFETPDEVNKRKSIVSESICNSAENTLRELLAKSLKGRIGKVWIDPKMSKIAVPLDMATGESGFGVLPTGSRIDIPEGKKIRAFTYWEKVNDIDLSCFGINKNGLRREYSWRSMHSLQSNDICFSGDETSGYNGGSEYFDINLESFQRHNPDTEYLVFCNNVYSQTPFNSCFCKAGFMMRDIEDSGEIFEPKTVDSSFQITCHSTFAYLFAIDLKKREMIWLNLSREGSTRVAGSTKMDWLYKYFTLTDVMDISKLYTMAGTPVDSVFADWDVAVTDMKLEPFFLKGREQVHSYDFEKVLSLLKSA